MTLSVRLIFPADLAASAWGTETSTTAEALALQTPITRRDGESGHRGQDVYDGDRVLLWERELLEDALDHVGLLGLARAEVPGGGLDGGQTEPWAGSAPPWRRRVA